MAINFAIGDLGVDRLEARASVHNGRGNGALRKVGATVEARLRQALARDGRHTDQLLWSIVKDEWSRSMVAKTVWGSRVH